MVYHGFAGHFFLKGISHVLKVRIIADMEERIRLIKDRNRVTTKEAIRYIEKLDTQRRKWSLDLYGIETSDPSLYDLVINVSQIPVEDAIQIICHKVVLKRFQTTPESQQKIEKLSYQADLKASLMGIKNEPKKNI